MSKYGIPLSFQHIIQFVYDSYYPTKEEIINHLKEKDQKVSPRTLERYLGKIRADLGVEIGYDHQNRGYFIDEENSVKVGSFFKFLEIVQVADIFSKSLKDSNTILDHVSFDDSNNFKGIENLKDVLLAITDYRKIVFNHENYEKETSKAYTITPLVLKEYLNRWYVVGAIDENEIRTFGIDRISDLKITEISNVKRENYHERLDKFTDTIGLTFGEGKPEKVCLLVDELHVKYLRSLPLHHSQIILPKNKNNRHEVRYTVYPNFEFKSQILKMGTQAEVLKPNHLRQEIAATLKKTLEQYTE